MLQSEGGLFPPSFCRYCFPLPALGRRTLKDPYTQSFRFIDDHTLRDVAAKCAAIQCERGVRNLNRQIAGLLKAI